MRRTNQTRRRASTQRLLPSAPANGSRKAAALRTNQMRQRPRYRHISMQAALDLEGYGSGRQPATPWQAAHKIAASQNLSTFPIPETPTVDIANWQWSR